MRTFIRPIARCRTPPGGIITPDPRAGAGWTLGRSRCIRASSSHSSTLIGLGSGSGGGGAFASAEISVTWIVPGELGDVGRNARRGRPRKGRGPRGSPAKVDRSGRASWRHSWDLFRSTLKAGAPAIDNIAYLPRPGKPHPSKRKSPVMKPTVRSDSPSRNAPHPCSVVGIVANGQAGAPGPAQEDARAFETVRRPGARRSPGPSSRGPSPSPLGETGGKAFEYRKDGKTFPL